MVGVLCYIDLCLKRVYSSKQMNITPIYTFFGEPVMTVEGICKDQRGSAGPSFDDLRLLIHNWNNDRNGLFRGKFVYLLVPMQPFLLHGDCKLYVPLINGEELKHNPTPYISWCCFNTPLTSQAQSYRFC